MYGTAANVIALTNVKPKDLGLDGENDPDAALTAQIDEWLEQITDLINRDRNRDFEAEGDRVTVLADTFADTDGTDLTAHTADTGQTWTQDLGTIEITDDEAVATAAEALATVPAVADGVVELSPDLGDDDEEHRKVGVVFRYQDVDNYWRAVLRRLKDGSASYVIVEKVDSGTAEVVAAEAVTVPEDAGHPLAVNFQGSRIRVSVDGVELLEFTDPFSPGTRAGLYFQASSTVTGWAADSFTVRGAPDVPPTVVQIAEDLASRMVTQAVATRQTPIVRIDDLSVRIGSLELLTADIRRRLARVPGKARLRIGRLNSG